ncbi:CHASE2 domain-containing protein [Allosphingosinicella sp.]|uniref:CHASE2 domain-containing protein n=1 Tax=Allosphingosinicella sp. TaxID=2823234 RepID=UPI003783A7BE
MADAGNAGRVTLKRAIAQIGWIRLALTVMFLAAGLLLARYSWELPLAADAERALYDLRFKSNANTANGEDPRITLVVYNDETLEGLRKRSPLDRRTLARALVALDRLGARAIGIDILIDQVQDEDAELVAAFQQMHTPTYLGFTTNAASPVQMEPQQEAFLRAFLAAVGPGTRLRPASIKLEADTDGVMRRWPARDSRLPTILANAMTDEHPEFRTYRGSIDYRLPANGVPPFPKISIEALAAIGAPDLPADARAALDAGFRDAVRGRYILIGGDIRDLDDFQTPMTRFDQGRYTKGLEVHAQMLAQQLDGRTRSPISPALLWLAAIILIVGGGLTGAFDLSGWRLAIVLVIQIVAIAWLPFLLHGMNVETIDLPAFGWGGGWLLAFIGVSAAARAVGSEQKRFAQSALGKYLPPDVAQEIMRNPELLALHGEQAEIYALFTDLEGFTKLSHAITPETLSKLLNRYLDLMSDIVLKHGGTLDKFVGDALVTFWGAPIARADDADRAVRAGREMFEAGERFRDMAAEIAGNDVPPIGVTRVGLHRGEAVVGNFGGEGRIQYTALGDAMNTAARLESANKALKTTMLVSDEAKRESTLDYFRPMGRIVLSGRATPVMVWEPVPDMERTFVGQLNEVWERFDAGDREALVQLEAIAADHKEDAALQYFVYRCREVGSGGHFVLGSK